MAFYSKLQKILHNMLQKEKVISENFLAVEAAATFSVKSFYGLTIEIYGGSYPKSDGTFQKLADLFTVTVPDNSTSFIEYDIATEQVVVKTAFTTGNIAICSCTAQEGYINGDSFEVVKVINFHVTGQAPGGGYNLPVATSTTLGGVKIDPATLGFNEDGQLKVIGGGGGGSGSLVVQSNGTTLNNNVTTLNIKSGIVASGGNTVSIDNFCTNENCIAYWRPVAGNNNAAFTLNSWTSSNFDNSLNTVATASNVWDIEHIKVMKTTAVVNNSNTFSSNQADLKRSIFNRNITRNSFGYDRRGNQTKGNTAYFNGLNGFTTTQDLVPFSQNFTSTNVNGICGVGWRNTDSNLQIIYTSAVTSQVVFIDLGVNFPIPDFSTSKSSYDVMIDSSYSEVDVSITIKRKDENYQVTELVPFLKQNYCRFKASIETHDAVIKYIALGPAYIYSR